MNKLTVGEIYYVWENKFWMLGMHLGGKYSESYGSFRDAVMLIDSTNRYIDNWEWCYKNERGREYRVATYEEKLWLRKCIEWGKYISKEEALKEFDYQIF